MKQQHFIGAPLLDDENAALSLGSVDGPFQIEESAQEPLTVFIDGHQELIIAKHVEAHLIFRCKRPGPNTVKLVVEEGGQAHLYYLPEEGELSSEIFVENQARLRLYEFGNERHGQSDHKLNIDLAGTGAELEYYGLHQLSGQAKKRSRLTIFHRAPRTRSTQSFRGIYSGSAEGHFLGKVVVEKNASLSEARQRYKAIILSSGATAEVLPQLEINNDDIKASHGASIGELDKNALFYLCSRGLSLLESRTCLINSLLADILDTIVTSPVKTAVQASFAQSVGKALTEV